MTSTKTRPYHILMVDDDPLVIKVYAGRMRFEGWSVAVARDGWDASQECRRSRFDLILLDIRMPFQNGVEVLKDIRGGLINADTPVYILTSLTENDDVDSALRLGADGVFFKAEVRPEDLVVRVRSILEPEEEEEEAEESAAVAAPQAEATLESEVDAVFAEMEPATEEEDPPRPKLVPVAVEQPVPEEFEFDLDFAGEPSGEDGDGGEAEDEADHDPDSTEVRLYRDYDVYVNPFLGDGADLLHDLDLADSFQCGECGGQIFLRLSPAPEAAGAEVVGHFLCSRCKTPA